MDAAESLAVLMSVSADVRRCAVVDGSGAAVASSPVGAGGELARTAAELLDAASPGAAVATIEVGMESGTVFVVREDTLTAVAVTGPEPASALVLHDLRGCLRRIVAGAFDA